MTTDVHTDHEAGRAGAVGHRERRRRGNQPLGIDLVAQTRHPLGSLQVGEQPDPVADQRIQSTVRVVRSRLNVDRGADVALDRGLDIEAVDGEPSLIGRAHARQRSYERSVGPRQGVTRIPLEAGARVRDRHCHKGQEHGQHEDDGEPSAERMSGHRAFMPQGYSTVTLFARFLGWSTSHPRSFATWYANSCNGTVTTTGESSSGVAGTSRT